jgi:hypothetical protein
MTSFFDGRSKQWNPWQTSRLAHLPLGWNRMGPPNLAAHRAPHHEPCSVLGRFDRRSSLSSLACNNRPMIVPSNYHIAQDARQQLPAVHHMFVGKSIKAQGFVCAGRGKEFASSAQRSLFHLKRQWPRHLVVLFSSFTSKAQMGCVPTNPRRSSRSTSWLNKQKGICPRPARQPCLTPVPQFPKRDGS